MLFTFLQRCGIADLRDCGPGVRREIVAIRLCSVPSRCCGWRKASAAGWPLFWACRRALMKRRQAVSGSLSPPSCLAHRRSLVQTRTVYNTIRNETATPCPRPQGMSIRGHRRASLRQPFRGLHVILALVFGGRSSMFKQESALVGKLLQSVLVLSGNANLRHCPVTGQIDSACIEE